MVDCEEWLVCARNLQSIEDEQKLNPCLVESVNVVLDGLLESVGKSTEC